MVKVKNYFLIPLIFQREHMIILTNKSFRVYVAFLLLSIESKYVMVQI